MKTTLMLSFLLLTTSVSFADTSDNSVICSHGEDLCETIFEVAASNSDSYFYPGKSAILRVAASRVEDVCNAKNKTGNLIKSKIMSTIRRGYVQNIKYASARVFVRYTCEEI